LPGSRIFFPFFPSESKSIRMKRNFIMNAVQNISETFIISQNCGSSTIKWIYLIQRMQFRNLIRVYAVDNELPTWQQFLSELRYPPPQESWEALKIGWRSCCQVQPCCQIVCCASFLIDLKAEDTTVQESKLCFLWGLMHLTYLCSKKRFLPQKFESLCHMQSNRQLLPQQCLCISPSPFNAALYQRLSDKFLSPPHMERGPYLSFPHNRPVLHTIIKVGMQTPYASPGKIKILPLHRDISLILVSSPLPKL
jgi:hypothetical protein